MNPLWSPIRALHERETIRCSTLKKVEFEIQFGTSQAEKGWKDLLATKLNSVVDAWDFLTRTPLEEQEKHHQWDNSLV